MSSEASGYNVGVLLMVEVTEDRRITQLEEASQRLVEILKSFSQANDRLLDLEEIERWRQSLTRQSQELSRREAEIEARQDQLQQWETTLRKGQLP
jgi:septum formation inhibitor MinC